MNATISPGHPSDILLSARQKIGILLRQMDLGATIQSNDYGSHVEATVEVFKRSDKEAIISRASSERLVNDADRWTIAKVVEGRLMRPLLSDLRRYRRESWLQ